MKRTWLNYCWIISSRHTCTDPHVHTHAAQCLVNCTLNVRDHTSCVVFIDSFGIFCFVLLSQSSVYFICLALSDCDQCLCAGHHVYEQAECVSLAHCGWPVLSLREQSFPRTQQQGNMFHQHTIDNQSLPYQSRAFPELSNTCSTWTLWITSPLPYRVGLSHNSATRVPFTL